MAAHHYILKMEKLWYIFKGLTIFDEIWDDDASRSLEKIPHYKYSRWRMATILKVEKLWYLKLFEWYW